MKNLQNLGAVASLNIGGDGTGWISPGDGTGWIAS